MLKKALPALTAIILIQALAVLLTYNARGILFRTLPWPVYAAADLGLITGILRGIRQNYTRPQSKGRPYRHNIDSFLEHWGTFTGILLLIISGFFIEASYRRGFAANLHFTGLVITLYFGAYFLAHFFTAKKYCYLMPGRADIIDGTIKKYLLRGSWQDTGKYSAARKSAFLGFSILGALLLITGALKTAAFYPGIPGEINYIATRVHDYSAYLFAFMFVIHIASALTTGSNRRKLISFFTSYINK